MTPVVCQNCGDPLPAGRAVCPTCNPPDDDGKTPLVGPERARAMRRWIHLVEAAFVLALFGYLIVQAMRTKTTGSSDFRLYMGFFALAVLSVLFALGRRRRR